MGAVSQFQKAELVAKLKPARERTGHLGGPERYSDDVVKLAKRLVRKKLSLRKISEQLATAGHFNANGKPHAQSIKNIIT